MAGGRKEGREGGREGGRAYLVEGGTEAFCLLEGGGAGVERAKRVFAGEELPEEDA